MSTAAVLFLLAYAAAVVAVSASGLVEGQAREIDFAAFWAAAKQLLAGDAAAAFDQAAFRSAQELQAPSPVGELFWLYPPGWQFLLAPLGLLPFWAAWLCFVLVSALVFAGSAWRLAAPIPMGRNLLIGAPAVVIVMALGQATLLWLAALIWVFHALERRQDAFAGLLLALLSLKPQLGVLLPVALVAAWRWKAILWACLGAAAVHGLPTAVVGLGYWQAFLERMLVIGEAFAVDGMPHGLMVTPYALARHLGAEHGLALGLQGLCSVALGAAVALVYALRPQPGGHFSGLPAGLLLIAIPLTTPYAFYYELAFAVPAAIYLVRGGLGAGPADRVLLAAALLGPAVLFLDTALAPWFAPILLLVFLRALLAERRTREVAAWPEPGALRPAWGGAQYSEAS